MKENHIIAYSELMHYMKLVGTKTGTIYIMGYQDGSDIFCDPVPVHYDPDEGAFSGLWDATFCTLQPMYEELITDEDELVEFVDQWQVLVEIDLET